MWTPSRVFGLQVVEVHENGSAQVVVGELEVSHLGGDDRLGARRERGVAQGPRLVVGEVARLLVVGERVAAQVERKDEVGLLDDLLAIELEVREMEEKAGRRGLRVAVELDVGARPELLEVVRLAGDESVPPGVTGLGEGGGLTAHGRQRPGGRPPVGEELDDLEALAPPKVRRDRDTPEVSAPRPVPFGPVTT